MAQVAVQVRIKGNSAILMHAFPLSLPENYEKLPPEKQAGLHVYRHDGEIHIPGEVLRRALVAGAAYSKGKGRGSLAKVAAAGLLVEPERCTLTPQDYTIDSRAVVIPATKGRIVRHRARWDTWEVSFRVLYNDALLSEPQVRRIIEDTGHLVGILDYRPEKKGPYGRFSVTLFSVE